MSKYRLIAAILLIISSNTLAQDWQNIKSPTVESITGIFMASPDTGYIVTSSGSCFKTNDKCQTWLSVNVPSFAGFESLTFLDPHTGWICGHNGTIIATKDGGKTWANQSWKDKEAIFFDIEMIDPDTGIVIGMRPTKENKRASIGLRTTDGGKNWSELETMGMAYSEIRNSKPDHKLYFMSLGRMNYTTDGTRSWQSNTTIEGPPVRTFSISGATGILGGLRGTLGYSNDSGKTWFKLDPISEDEHFISSALLDPNNGYLGGTHGYMVVTNNGGRSWQAEKLPISFTVMDMFATKDRVYAVGGEGRILYKSRHQTKN